MYKVKHEGSRMILNLKQYIASKGATCNMPFFIQVQNLSSNSTQLGPCNYGDLKSFIKCGPNPLSSTPTHPIDGFNQIDKGTKLVILCFGGEVMRG